mgnify:CR=1 FL=1
MVRRGGLELCSCGYPAPDKYLRWGDVYVAGALAELELGPSARNIAGARLAAERIVEGVVEGACVSCISVTYLTG